MPKISHTVLAAGLLSLSAGVIAQPPAPPRDALQDDPRMKAPETRAELKARLEARFDRMDANHDGKIDEKDPEARRAARVAERFSEIDADKNGTISKAEFAAAEERRGPPEGPMGMRRFGPMGGPERGMLFDHRGREGMMMMRGRLPFAPPPGGFGRRGPMAGGPMTGSQDRKPGEALAKSDFVNQGLARFDKVDTDHDGKISAAERDAFRATRGARNMPPPPQTQKSGQ